MRTTMRSPLTLAITLTLGAWSVGTTMASNNPHSTALFRGDAARSGRMAAATLTGTPVARWRFQAGSPILTGALVTDGRIVMTTSGGVLYVLDAVSGAVVWQRALGDTALTTPAVVGDSIIVGSRAGTVDALDLATGDLRGAAWAVLWGRCRHCGAEVRAMTRCAAGESNIRQRKPGQWEARYIDATGRSRSLCGPTKRAVTDRLLA